MIIRSKEITLALAITGLLSYAACTADKTSMKTEQTSVVPSAAPENPKLVDGVFATDDHLQAVYFDLNKSKISDAAMDAVKSNAEWIKNQPPYLIRIIGFADLRGSSSKNLRLAHHRADSLRDAYVAMGISKERISVKVGNAETLTCQPITEDCLSKCRRSETLLEQKPVEHTS